MKNNYEPTILLVSAFKSPIFSGFLVIFIYNIVYRYKKIQTGVLMKIAIIGAGYVGLSLATLFSEHHEVVLVDVLKEKIDQINRRISPINDEVITQYFQ